MNRITEKRNYLAMTVVAIAAMFIVPAGLANADHEPTNETIFSKSIVACPTEIEVRQTTSTACSFSISYNNPGVPATIKDTVPAEWEVTNADAIELATDCTVDPANKGKKANRSATKIVCPDTESLNLTFELETRESPSTVKHTLEIDKYKPTSCDPQFAINDGAHAVDPITGELIASTLDLSTIATDPEDTDCDGVANVDDTCEGFDDALDEDSDGIPDGCDNFPNDTDNDGLTNDVDLDDDNDGFSDAEEILAGTDPLDVNDHP